VKRPLTGKETGKTSMAVALAGVAVLAGMLLLDSPARADLAEGRDYAVLAPKEQPITPAAKGKTEVIQFFSYGCPHCAHMNPFITQWAEKLPANVKFVRVPVAFGRPEWGALSRAYYTLMNLGELQRLNGTVFETIHQQQQRIFDEENLTAWAAKQGIDSAKFRAEYNSERVSKAVMEAEALTRTFAVESIPKIIVARRYQVVAEAAKTYDDFFATTNQIIDKAVKEQSAKR
jgi:thiol:disulfide interchange protein DsbA